MFVQRGNLLPPGGLKASRAWKTTRDAAKLAE